MSNHIYFLVSSFVEPLVLIYGGPLTHPIKKRRPPLGKLGYKETTSQEKEKGYFDLQGLCAEMLAFESVQLPL